MKLSPFAFSLSIAGTATLALSPGISRAANEPLFELPDVAVIAHSLEHPLIVEIDPNAPAQPIPAQDGAEVLRGIPGFNVIRKGGTDGDPVLRGMAGSRLGIVLDGENVLGGCGHRMDPPTAYVFPSAYDRVTVLKGPQTVLYGPGSSAGVVLFERDPQPFAGPGVEVEGAVTVGSFGRNDQLLDIRAGDRHGYIEGTATRTSANDYEDGSGRSVASQYDRWSAHLAIGWTPVENTLLELSAIRSDGEAAYADRMMDGSRFARENLGLRFRRSGISDLVRSVEANVFYNYVDHVMDNFSLRDFAPSMMMPGRAASNPDRLTYGGRATVDLGWGESSQLTTGIDFQGNRHRNRSTSDEPDDPYGVKERERDAEFAAIGLFFETTRSMGVSGRLVSGARLDFWRAEDHRQTVPTGMSGSAPNPTAEAVREDALPSAFIRYEHDLGEHTHLSLGLGHAQRFPDYWEIFSKESAGSVSAFSTEAERTTQIDLGLIHQEGPLTTSIAFFINRVDDFILIESGIEKPGMMSVRNATIARNVETEALGGEASILYRFAPGWEVDGSLSYVRGNNRTDDLPLAQQPPLEARLGVRYTGTGWMIGGLARLVDEQDRYALNQGNIVGQDLGRSAGFAIFSLHGSWRPSRQFRVTAGIDNIFDKTYAEHLSRGGSFVAGFPPPTMRVNEPGRTWWLKGDFQF